jgi:hypothetical protein
VASNSKAISQGVVKQDINGIEPLFVMWCRWLYGTLIASMPLQASIEDVWGSSAMLTKSVIPCLDPMLPCLRMFGSCSIFIWMFVHSIKELLHYQKGLLYNLVVRWKRRNLWKKSRDVSTPVSIFVCLVFD